jgi:uncharacterized protein YodC (DUF2158 family)
MQNDFEVGQVVMLKSGGPEMTIETIDDYGSGHSQAHCVWFEENKRQSAIFEFHSLQGVT